MSPRFERLSSTSGVRILDPIEKRQFSLLTPTPVSPEPASTDDFYFPVSVARSMRTAAVELPYAISVYVRDVEGTMVTDVDTPADVSLPRDRYLVEMGAPVKLYLRVESELEIAADPERIELSFGSETDVRVGARSRHESPAGTVTVPDDPEGVMAGLSVLSSSLKTTSPERSFPTLRGHPPRIERGDRVEIPDGFDRPDTGVGIEIPPAYEYLYPVAPLAFYLGAELVAGDVPRLFTERGFEHRLDSHRGFESEVERVLKQTFFLDCVVRTEGYYPIELAERNAVEPRLDLDFADLYDRSLAERTEQFLDVPYAAVEDAVPDWHRVTYVRPEAENVRLLPYVVNDLSLVRTPPDEDPVAEGEAVDELWNEIDEFYRSPPSETVEEEKAFFRGAAESDPAEFTRSGPEETSVSGRDYVSIPETETIETAWAGRGTPTSGTKLLPAAYEHDRTLPEDGVIDVAVVCNDPRMRREWDAVSEIYGSRDDVAIEATVEFGVGTERLRELLTEPTDFFHFIGHVDDRGFQCKDGFLDAETLEGVSVRAFMLNACHSHDQGEALVEAGARAGIVSLSEVGNRNAVEFGETLVKLFHNGFSVGTALTLTGEYTTVGSRYIGLGDVGLILAQNADTNMLFYEIIDRNAEQITVDVGCYPNRDYPIGSIVNIYLIDNEKQYLQPSPLTTVNTTKDDFKGVVEGDSTPVIIDDELRWSDRLINWHEEPFH